LFFLTNKRLPRRTFLRGLGTTLALPLLESMLPTRGALAAQKQIVPTRFLGAFVPHGIAPGHWIPETSGPGFAYPYVYEPLQPFRKHVVLTSGMWSKSSENPPGVTGAAIEMCGTEGRLMIDRSQFTFTLPIYQEPAVL